MGANELYTFLKWSLMIGVAAIITIPLFKMAVDYAAGKVSALSAVKTYVDKA